MRFRRSLRILSPIALLVVALVFVVACGGGAPTEKEIWYCPMHPEVTSDRPGSCPICHMDLVKREPSPPVAAAGSATSAAEPSPARTIAAAGVATVDARDERAPRRVRTVGRVLADERRQARVESRVAGWVTGLDADFTGRRVGRGDRLATIDSPELFAAQSEYLAAREAARNFLASSLPEVRRGGDDLILAARRRLELLGVPEQVLEELERTRVARRGFEVVAPAAGVVTEKGIVRGQRIEPGMMLFTLLDLSAVWIEADLYESDAAAARVGQPAAIGLAYDPAYRADARASYVYPQLDPATRTLRVRFDVGNPGEMLKPGMFVDVEVELGELAGVTVPDAAVLATGERALVFVADGQGGFTPREVHLAGRQGGRTFVEHGLAAGERVAAEAAFLLDAESRLREASGAVAAPAATGHEGHR